MIDEDLVRAIADKCDIEDASTFVRLVLDELVKKNRLYENADPWFTRQADGTIWEHWPEGVRSALVSREFVEQFVRDAACAHAVRERGHYDTCGATLTGQPDDCNCPHWFTCGRGE